MLNVIFPNNTWLLSQSDAIKLGQLQYALCFTHISKVYMHFKNLFMLLFVQIQFFSL